MKGLCINKLGSGLIVHRFVLLHCVCLITHVQDVRARTTNEGEILELIAGPTLVIFQLSPVSFQISIAVRIGVVVVPEPKEIPDAQESKR